MGRVWEEDINLPVLYGSGVDNDGQEQDDDGDDRVDSDPRTYNIRGDVAMR
jgi:hypothetical protein